MLNVDRLCKSLKSAPSMEPIQHLINSDSNDVQCYLVQNSSDSDGSVPIQLCRFPKMGECVYPEHYVFELLARHQRGTLGLLMDLGWQLLIQGPGETKTYLDLRAGDPALEEAIALIMANMPQSRLDEVANWVPSTFWNMGCATADQVATMSPQEANPHVDVSVPRAN